jgi:predicted NBD/HSP70 family sugar kinase
VENQRLDGVGSILRALRGAGRLTRQELAQASGMGRSQLLQRLDVLRELGIVEERLTSSSTGGRRPRAASIRPGQGHVLVAALGVTGVTVAAVDLSGRVVDTRQNSLEIALGPDRVLTECVRLLTDLTQANGLGPSWGMGISVPGPVDHQRGMVVSPPVMPGWDQFPIRDWLGDRFGTACWLDNDVNVMAVGEQRYGAGRGHDDFIFVKLGHGIGSGLVMGGVLQRGSRGCAGDIGHLPVMDAPVPCRCGNVGCLEAVAGGMALDAAAERLVLEGASRRLAELTAGRTAGVKDLVRAAELGDTTCLAVLQQAGDRIGAVLAHAVSLLNPSLVILGGGLLAVGDAMFTSMRKSLYGHALPLAARELVLTRTELGNTAAVLGIAEVVLDELFSPAHIESWWHRGAPAGLR